MPPRRTGKPAAAEGGRPPPSTRTQRVPAAGGTGRPGRRRSPTRPDADTARHSRPPDAATARRLAATIGCTIKDWRERRGLTQEELAAQVGISQGLLSRYELGRVQGISYGRVGQLARALDITINALTEGDETEVRHTEFGM